MSPVKGYGGILVFLQKAGNMLHPVSIKTANIAAHLAKTASCAASYVVSSEGETPYSSGKRLISAIYQQNPDVLIVGSTELGRVAASAAAAHFGLGIAADCTELIIDADMVLLQKRPAFGGGVIAWVKTESRPQIATIQPEIVIGTGENATDFFSKATEILCGDEVFAYCSSNMKILETTEIPKLLGIEDAPLIIALGGGVNSSATVEYASKIAKKAGGEVAGSRVIIQRGWLPPERQIGLSGKAVSPKLLVTLGVSGSQQFLAGASGSEYTISVNTDKDAPIFASANLPIISDLHEILPHLERLVDNHIRLSL